MHQAALFDDSVPPPPALPPGLVVENGFLSPGEEGGLIALMRGLPFAAARYKGYTARRRVVSYGGSFDYDANRLLPAEPLIEALHPLRDRAASGPAFRQPRWCTPWSPSTPPARPSAGTATCPTSRT